MANHCKHNIRGHCKKHNDKCLYDGPKGLEPWECQDCQPDNAPIIIDFDRMKSLDDLIKEAIEMNEIDRVT